MERARLRCRFCRWTVVARRTRAGKRVSGHLDLRNHVGEEHPRELREIDERCAEVDARLAGLLEAEG